jgi:hypothetical protein
MFEFKNVNSKWRTACKNPNCHSGAGKESHIFSSQKIKRGDPSAFSLRMTRKGKLARILEHSHSK